MGVAYGVFLDQGNVESSQEVHGVEQLSTRSHGQCC